jgi:hypothetical protein
MNWPWHILNVMGLRKPVKSFAAGSYLTENQMWDFNNTEQECQPLNRDFGL